MPIEAVLVVRGEDRVITGEINDEQLKRISDLTTQNPEFQEIIHGPTGYKSPYRTIEQIAQDRKSGVIAPSGGENFKSLFEEIIDNNQPKLNGPTEVGAAVATPLATKVTEQVAKKEVKEQAKDEAVDTAKEQVTEEVKEQAGEELLDKVKEKAVDKVKDKAKDKAKEKFKGAVEKVTEEPIPTLKKIGVKKTGTKAATKATTKTAPKAAAATAAATATTGVASTLAHAAGKTPPPPSFVKKAITSVIGEEGMDAIKSMGGRATLSGAMGHGKKLASAVTGGHKNSSALRLAGTAALLSVAGYAAGRVGKDKQSRKATKVSGPTEEQRIRQQLSSDG
jgi:hypothetical protein